MLTAFANAFRTPDLRKKILFTLGILAIFRLGSLVPTPNVNATQVQTCLKQATSGNQQGLYSLINLFSGGALLQLAIFALGHHALHHRQHHPPAADRGDPAGSRRSRRRARPGRPRSPSTPAT